MKHFFHWFLLITLATIRLNVSYTDGRHQLNLNLEGKWRAQRDSHPLIPA
jgi:hypothetical protein